MIFLLKILNRAYSKIALKPAIEKIQCEKEIEKVSNIIYNKLMEDKPCMIGRFGSTELLMVLNYIGVKENKKNIWKYIKGEALPWWWNKNIMQQMQQWSGFFPVSKDKIEKFCELMLDDMNQVDILGSWLFEEKYFMNKLRDVTYVDFELLNPYFSTTPWTKVLQNKRVLVIHPFAEQIEMQYQKRQLLFKNKDILPDFNLITLKAVQSLGGGVEGFSDWFAALEWMKEEMNKQVYDICLIGAGAYGFCLAAHAKRQGKKAIHMGGGLQLLFGIRGRRWENPNYNPNYNYSELMNEFWIRPNERPKNADNIEGACYW